MTRLVVILLVLASACGPRAMARVEIAHSAIDAGALILYDLRAESIRLQRAERGPCDHGCIKKYDRAYTALTAARESLKTARRSLGAMDAQAQQNPGAVISCAAAAVGRALTTVEALGYRLESRELQVWQQYVATIGTICDLGVDPNASVYRGSAPAEVQ